MKNLWEKVGPIMGGLITNPKVARIKNPKKAILSFVFLKKSEAINKSRKT
jgi:hypothetical protein